MFLFDQNPLLLLTYRIPASPLEQAVLRDIEQIEPKFKTKWQNFSRAGWVVLRSLLEDSSTIIKEAVKGGDIVVQDRAAYDVEVIRQLWNWNTIYQLQGGSTHVQ